MNRSVFLILSFHIFLTFSAVAQTGYKLNGTVLDKETRKPLAGANIIIVGAAGGISAGDNGEFQLVLTPGPHWLKISYIGYSTKQVIVDIDAGSKNSIEIELEVDPLLTESVLVEEEIQQSRYVPQKITMTRKFITGMITTTPDLFQSIKKMPGVHTVSDKSAEFNVRGSHFDEHLTTICGVPVARPFHLKSGSYESISIFNPEMIEAVEFYPGNFPVKYGWKMASAMELKYRQGSRDSFMVTTSVNTLRTNIVLEGPVKKSGSWIVGVRKSYLDYWLKSVRPFENGQGDFFDVQSNIRIEKSKNLWFDFTTISGMSGFEQTPANHSYIMSSPVISISKNISGNEKARWRTLLQSIKLSHVTSQNSMITLTGAYYCEFNDSNSLFYKESSYIGPNSPDPIEYSNYSEKHNKLDFDRLYFRAELEHELKENAILTTGIEYMANDIDVYMDSYSISYDGGATSEGFTDAFNQMMSQRMVSLYAGMAFQTSQRIFVYPGVRFQNDKLTGKTTMNISTSFSRQTDSGNKIFGGIGMYHQPPSYVEFMSTGVDSANSYINQKTVQGSFGAQWKRADGGHFKFEAYSKYSPEILPYIFEDGRYNYEFNNRGKAYSYGFDLSLSGLMNENVHGMVSYGFMKARERLESENNRWIPRATDRTHSFNLGLIHTVNPNTGLKFIFNFTVGFGFPYTGKNIKRYDSGLVEMVDAERNAMRFRPYKRLDIRWARELNDVRIRNYRFNGDVYVEIVNIWNIKNKLKKDWEYFGANIIEPVPTYLTPRMYGGGFRLTF